MGKVVNIADSGSFRERPFESLSETINGITISAQDVQSDYHSLEASLRYQLVISTANRNFPEEFEEVSLHYDNGVGLRQAFNIAKELAEAGQGADQIYVKLLHTQKNV